MIVSMKIVGDSKWTEAAAPTRIMCQFYCVLKTW